MEWFLKFCRSAGAGSSEIPVVAFQAGVAKRVSWACSPRPFGDCKPPPRQEKSALGISSQRQEWARSQITVTTRDCRRHRDPLDDRHPYDSMQRYAELLALKYQKMKGNEPFSDPQFLSSFVNRRRFCNESLFQKNQNK